MHKYSDLIKVLLKQLDEDGECGLQNLCHLPRGRGEIGLVPISSMAEVLKQEVVAVDGALSIKPFISCIN